MRRARLLRSTPFRLALSFGVFFIVAFLVVGLVAYGVMKRELSQSLDVSIRDTYSVVASTFSPDDIEDLVAAVSIHSSLKQPEDQAFLLLDSNGVKLAGNIQMGRFEPGFSTLSTTSLGLDHSEPIRILTGVVGSNTLVVGQSYHEIDRIEHIAWMSFSWASIIIAATVMLGGALLARRTQRRLEAVEEAMVDVSAGNLTRRIPICGNGDDIDVVSTLMNEALARLCGLVEGMRQVSVDIAHDLKTPLNRLGLMIEQSLQRLEKGGDVEDLMFDARSEIARINATFEALLRISQIEAGARRTRFKETDLQEVMASVAEIYSDVAEDNLQTLRFHVVASNSCLINGDHELLTQLFANLVENAITHCPAGTSIVMSLTSEQHHYRACVSDSGPGIAEAERELVFRRLYRIDKSRTTPGSGLGLSLVKAVAELHAAHISLEDNEPGLRISLRLPKMEAGRSPVPTNEAPRTLATSAEHSVR